MTERVTAPAEGHRPKAVHVSIVHQATDVRVFVRECRSVAAAGYDVTLFARSPQAFEEDGVRVVPVPEPTNRLARMTVGTWGLLRPLLREGGDVYHLHDPELIPLGVVLRLFGKKVVYDAHEDLPAQVLGKVWIPTPLRPAVAAFARLVIQLAGRGLSAVVAATPTVAEGYGRARVVVVCNYPLILDDRPAIPYAERTGGLVYVGALSGIRGFDTMLEVARIVHEKRGLGLTLVGRLQPASLEADLAGTEAYVDYRGVLPSTEARRLMGESKVGLVLLRETKAIRDALPTKMFEYMAEGLPVVSSNFPLWTEIVEDSGAGRVVSPTDTEAAAQAVLAILDDPEEAAAMADRGRKAVAERYSWEPELRKLLDLYADLVPAPPRP
jgi:glycosyltransferase involved in cell wall biosynthesis